MLAQLLKTGMLAKGWSQNTLADTSGLGQATISLLLNKRLFNITPLTANKLAVALDIPVEQVMAAALSDVKHALASTAA